ncbi:MAG: DUF861 domain-containing protein [Ignavibacteriae bacterium]|nr:MAG: DUF861 domain-containing protein [Ignavibacteriota bacterium]
MIKKRFEEADEVRTPSKTRVEIINMGDRSAMKATFEPGWSWDECIKPVAGTDSCQVHHLTYVISGKMKIKMEDGKEDVFTAGDVVDIPPGHHAWVVGNEPCVSIDFGVVENYAKKQ